MASDSLSVLIASPEITPLAQTGGLAEVAGGLPLALKEAGVNVAVAMPAYRSVLDKLKGEITLAASDLPVRIGATHLSADVYQGELAPGIPLFLIRRDEFFDRSELYGTNKGDYFDNPERFTFFCRALLAFCPTAKLVPEVILANDWQTGLIMPLLDLGALPRTAGVFTVHNQKFLGLVPPERTGNLGLPDRYNTMEGLEYFGQMSLLKAGIVYAQAVTTVSPTYAEEVQTPEGGHGLDGVMRKINHRLFGILNGVDYRVWNPETDQVIKARYSKTDLAGKALCKKDLLRRFDLPQALADKPLLGMVTRLSPQKGIPLILDAAEEIFRLGIGLVVLGDGDEEHRNMVQTLKERLPDQVSVRLGFDPGLAHAVIAGSDMLLMPSMYEPCGLAQMYALKYGTVPIVRATGGLNDTVFDPEDGVEPGTGFKFGPFQHLALIRAVRRAVEAYARPEVWRRIMAAGMNMDFSWNRSAREYIKVFEQAAAARRGGRP